MKKRPLLALLFIICYLFFVLAACSEPSTEETGEGYFTISLSAYEGTRAVYPPTDTSDLRLAAKFKDTANGAEKTYTSDGSGTIRGKIDVGNYIVTMDISLISDSSPYARGIAFDNPVVIGSGQNNIKAYAYDVKNSSPPVITAKPQGRTYSYGDTTPPLEVSASVNDGGVISYQWYSNTTNSVSGGAAISGATLASYMPPTATPGTAWHYVAVTNTSTGKPTTVNTAPVAIVVGANPNPDPGTEPGPGTTQTFTNVSAFQTWLSAQPNNTAYTAYNVALNISSLGNLKTVLDSAPNKYVSLDLSGSTFTSIGEEAFYECTNLTSVTIGNSVTSIGNGAFSYCTSLTGVTIPDSVTYIGTGVFCFCYSLAAINVEAANTAYSSQDGVLYNKNKTALHTYPAGKAGSSFSIPPGVTSIEREAFSDCASLTGIILPSGVTDIGFFAFDGCSSLTGINIPDKRKMTHFTQLQS